jgi:alkylated DNA nucleotide flippase Atl1
MASSRADEVAEILWELKRAGKLATYTAIACRAGFSAGSDGRAMQSCLMVVRRDWPHLQWWRAIPDNHAIIRGSQQSLRLTEAGYEFTQSTSGHQDSPSQPETVSLIVDSNVSPGEIALFLQYLNEQYKNAGGNGLTIVNRDSANVADFTVIHDIDSHLMNWEQEQKNAAEGRFAR